VPRNALVSGDWRRVVIRWSKATNAPLPIPHSAMNHHAIIVTVCVCSNVSSALRFCRKWALRKSGVYSGQQSFCFRPCHGRHITVGSGYITVGAPGRGRQTVGWTSGPGVRPSRRPGVASKRPSSATSTSPALRLACGACALPCEAAGMHEDRLPGHTHTNTRFCSEAAAWPRAGPLKAGARAPRAPFSQ
jgi:hypothetical protein